MEDRLDVGPALLVREGHHSRPEALLFLDEVVVLRGSASGCETLRRRVLELCGGVGELRRGVFQRRVCERRDARVRRFRFSRASHRQSPDSVSAPVEFLTHGTDPRPGGTGRGPRGYSVRWAFRGRHLARSRGLRSALATRVRGGGFGPRGAIGPGLQVGLAAMTWPGVWPTSPNMERTLVRMSPCTVVSFRSRAFGWQARRAAAPRR